MFAKTEFVTNNSIAFLPETLEFADFDDETTNPIFEVKAFWFERRHDFLLAAYGDIYITIDKSLLPANPAAYGWKVDDTTYPLILKLADHSAFAKDGNYVAQWAWRKLGGSKPYSHPDLEKEQREQWDADLKDMLTYSLPPAGTDGWYSLLKKMPKHH